jgi:hypothetical protein
VNGGIFCKEKAEINKVMGSLSITFVVSDHGEMKVYTHQHKLIKHLKEEFAALLD